MKELQSCFQTGEVAWKKARRSQSWSRGVKEGVKLTFPSQLKQCTGMQANSVQEACRAPLVLQGGDSSDNGASISYACAHTPILPIPKPI